MRSYLPADNILDTVYFGPVGHPVYFNGVSWWRKFRCTHKDVAPAVWIDHRSGPGSFADNHFVIACVDCGRVFGPDRQGGTRS